MKIFLSLDRENLPATTEDFEYAKDLLQAIEVDGCYNGIKERSLMVNVTSFALYCLAWRIAKQYQQESILIVENNNCYMIYLNGRSPEFVGKWVKTENKDMDHTVIGKDIFTIDYRIY